MHLPMFECACDSPFFLTDPLSIGGVLCYPAEGLNLVISRRARCADQRCGFYVIKILRPGGRVVKLVVDAKSGAIRRGRC